MEFINATRMVAGFSLATEKTGRELLVIVIKGTFDLPRLGDPLKLAAAQLPLVLADTFSGAPGFSAPCHEADFAPRKTRCDVLLLGSAYAPNGRPASRVVVGLRVGSVSKTIAVLGERHWESCGAGFRASPPASFTTTPISYDVAFGGVDRSHPDPAQHAAFMPNPVGRGYCRHLKRAWVEGRALPATEQTQAPVTRPDGAYAPMAFGPLGRGWAARSRYAGTYDDAWFEKDFPFLPADFDERYFQAAPPDQQLPIAAGRKEVTLVNLTPDGLRRFDIPDFAAPVHVFTRNGKREDWSAMLDTLILEPDHERVTMNWRVCRPLRENIFEIGQVIVGKKGPEWWQQREARRFPVEVVMVPMRPRQPEVATS